MKNFTLLGRLPLLVVCFFGLLAGPLAAQCDQLTPANVDVMVNNTCDEQAPTVFVAFDAPNPNLNGPAIIKYDIVFNGGLVLNTQIEQPVMLINGDAVFTASNYPLFYGFFGQNSRVRILRLDLVGGCSANWEVNPANAPMSNPFDLNDTPSGLSFSQESLVDPPCAGQTGGAVGFNIEPASGPRPFNRFSARLLPFDPSVTVTIIPMGSDPGNVDSYRLETNTQLTAGVAYNFLILDNVTGCEVSRIITLNGNTNFIVDAVTAADAQCSGAEDGAIDITPMASFTNGTLGYEVVGNNTGVTRGGVILVNGFSYPTITLAGFPADVYTITLTSTATGCTAQDFVTISEPEPITLAMVDAPTVCASEGAFTVNFSGISGVDADNSDDTDRFRLVDPSLLDMDPSNNSGCWTLPGGGREPLSAYLNQDGSFSYTIGFKPGCVQLAEDTTVNILLELYDGASQCTRTFPFTLQINARPQRPDVDVYTLPASMDDDTLNGSFCTGEEIEILIPNYDPALDYFIEYRNGQNNFGPGMHDTIGDFDAASIPYTGPGSVTGGFAFDGDSPQTVFMRAFSVNPATGCASNNRNFEFTVLPAPRLDSLMMAGSVAPDLYTDTICSNSDYATPTFSVPNGNYRATYEWVLTDDLTITSGPASGDNGANNNNRINLPDVRLVNAASVQASAQLIVTPYQVNDRTTYSEGTFFQDTCFGASQVLTVTVDPAVSIAVTGNDSTAVALNSTTIPVVTICSGDTVAFTTLVNVEGTFFRVLRETGLNSNVVNAGDGSPLTNERLLNPADGLIDTLVNTGTAPELIVYTFFGYTFGADGEDGNGNDCPGPRRRLIVEVLPDISDEASLSLDLFTGADPSNFGSAVGSNLAVDTVCAGSWIGLDLATTIDPATGVAYKWTRTNDRNDDVEMGTIEVTNVVQLMTNGPVSEILARLENETADRITYTYTIQLYTFGANGMNEGLSETGDDCLGASRTISITVEPEPILMADAVIGAPLTLTSGDDIFIELCSQDNFSISNLSFATADLDNRVAYVLAEFDGGSEAEFLNIPDGAALVEIDGFQIGKDSVRNTSGLPYFASIRLTPSYINLSNNEACEGEPITIQIVLNPEVTTVAPVQSFTSCNDTAFSYALMGGSNVSESAVIGSASFGTGTEDFVFPVGAARIEGVRFTISGADGGGAASVGLPGGRGASIEGMFPGNNVRPGDTIRVQNGNAGSSFADFGNGGDASVMYLIAGPLRSNSGSVIGTIIAGGGGGAGRIDPGVSVSTAFSTTSPSSGETGTGPGGNGGQSGPSFAGGTGFNVGGGGGGGRNGGDGGNSAGPGGASSATGTAGLPGTSWRSGAGLTSLAAELELSIKEEAEANGSASIAFRIFYDDVRFTLQSVTPDLMLVAGADNDPIGETDTDTILFGDSWTNSTDGPLDVVYVFSTGTEANCPGGQVTVTATIEPTPKVELASNGTTLMGDAANGYTATICSGDSLSAFLSSVTMPSAGANWLRAEVVDVTAGPNITFGASSNGQHASGSTNFGGNNQPAVANVLFFESSITNEGVTAEEVVYTVVPLIDGGGTGGNDCIGDTIFLTVSVNPAVITIAPGPIQTNLCSGASVADGGFNLPASQPMVQIDFDSIMIDTVYNSLGAAGSTDFDTLSSVYAGVPVMVTTSTGFFGTDAFRNRTGGPVIVTYKVRLVSGPGCFSDPITYDFRYTAEPVILLTESASNQIDTTICNGDATGLVVFPAPNSAWSNPADFQNNVDLNIEADIPQGVNLTGGTYPAVGDRFLMADDELENTTDAPLDVVYTVTPVNNGCEGDAVVYTVTVNPNPDATVQLVSLDSTSSFSLENSRAFLNPNPAFGMCSGQALHASVPAVATAANGTLMAVMTVTVDDDGLSGYTVGAPMRFPASELGDSLSYAMGELVNLTGMPQSFTVQYFTFFEGNGTLGNQNDGIDCSSNGVVEFDIVVNPVNSAFTRIDDTNGTPIPSGSDTLCSGAAFDLVVRAVTNDPMLPAIDSFFVEVHAPAGTVAGIGTESDDFWITDQNTSGAYGRRLEDLSFENVTAGIKTIRYIATPYSMGCAGVPDTTTISFRPETVLELNQPIVCASEGVATAIFVNDANGQILTTANADYRWEYIGGTASGFSITRANGNGFQFIGDPANQANMIVFNNEQTLLVTPAQSLMGGEINFEVIYDNLTNGNCGTVTDTVTLILSGTATAGTPDPSLGVLCDGVNFLLSDALLDESPGGVFTFANGDPVPGAPNFTPMVGGTGTDPVAIEFTYTAGGSNSGCTEVSTNFTLMVEPAPSAGTVVGVGTEACQAAAFLNLYDLLTGETQGGTFTQTSGTDFVAVGSDGVFDQSTVTPGVYTYDYEVASSFGCNGDVVSGITFEVRTSEDCSTPISCDVIELVAGFNVISFDVIPNDNSIRNIFADVIADESLVQIIGLRAEANNGSPQTFGYVPVIIPGAPDRYVGGIDGGILGGYGYIVQVNRAATIEVCGPDVDVDFRAPLQAGPNFIGYAPQTPESVSSYFDDLVANDDLNSVRTFENGVSQGRVYGVLPFPIGPLRDLKNGFGYIIDVNTAYPTGDWKTNSNIQPTSVFDQLYGAVENGKRFVGETFQFVNANGEVFGEAKVSEHGTYFGAYLFGDVSSTQGQVEGFLDGEEIFISYNGNLIETGLTFDGNWTLDQLDVNLESVISDVDETTVSDISVLTYPNPTNGLTTLEINLQGVNPHYIRAEVFNTLGQLVISQTIDSPQTGLTKSAIDFTDLAAGTYQLRILSNEGLIGHQQIIRK